MLPEDTIETPGGLTPITSLTDNAEFEIKEPSLSVNNKIIKSNLRATMGIDLNTAYKDRVKTKVLWTGPLSVVGVPTSLDGGEKFSNWDYVLISSSVFSDLDVNTMHYSAFFNAVSSRISWNNSGNQIIFRVLSDSTFDIVTKTVPNGNIQTIIGISL